MRYAALLLTLSIFTSTSCKRTVPGATAPAAPAVATATVQHAPVVKQAHLDDGWYSKDATKLSAQIDGFFDAAVKQFYVEADPEAVRVVIAPHAGLQYSGLCAATAYQTLLTNKNLLSPDLKNKKINHVVILAPDHTGLAVPVGLPHYTHYQTPLGTVPVNSYALALLAQHNFCRQQPEAHNKEHAIEMQLPFLQKSIEAFSITPLIIGTLDQYDMAALTQTLKAIIDDHTLVVISSDFTHHGERFRYPVFASDILHHVRALDSLALEAIMQRSQQQFEDAIERTQATICGQYPLRLLLNLLDKEIISKVESRLCCYYTSAHMVKASSGQAPLKTGTLLAPVLDAEGTDSVSYAGIIFTAQQITALKQENQLTGFEKKALLACARQTITNELSLPKLPKELFWPVISPSLERTCGAFVTLHDAKNQLRGCIGRVTSLAPLYQTVQDMALAAAFKDSRFAPLTMQELQEGSLSVTILTPPHIVAALSEIVVGRHGIILNKFKDDGTLQASAVFLPQVAAELGWDLATTLAELSLKAGLAADGWQDGCQLQIFEGYEIKEEA